MLGSMLDCMDMGCMVLKHGEDRSTLICQGAEELRFTINHVNKDIMNICVKERTF